MVSPSFHILSKLNKIIPLYKYNHPQCKCHCQTPKNKKNMGHKERNTPRYHRNKSSSQWAVGCTFAWTPQIYPELCNDFSSDLGGSLHILAAGTGKVPGLPMAGWWSGTLRPWLGLQIQAAFCFPQNVGAQTTKFPIRMQWAESKFDGNVLSCAMCIAFQLLVGKMFLILQIPGHLYG